MESIIYNKLISFTLPWAIENSEISEEELKDYIHDFYCEIMGNKKENWCKINDYPINRGIWDLELVSSMNPSVLTRFFFQFVVRQSYKEGQWIDRRNIGRRTQRETETKKDRVIFVAQPKEDYTMEESLDIKLFIQSLDEDEKTILNEKLDGCFIKDSKFSKRIHCKILNRLQVKAKKFF